MTAKLIAVVGILTLAVASGTALLWNHESDADAVADLATGAVSDIDSSIDAERVANGLLDVSFGRPNYRYSVIPGGAYDASELRTALTTDAVVAAHYRGLDPSRVRVETVRSDRRVYVSYRKGNQVFWTRKPVLLRQGETILTDGKTQIRSRCGNCISEEPLLPVAEDEPETVEFDALEETPDLPLTPDVAFDDPIVPAGAGATTPLIAPPTALAGGRFGVASIPPLAAGTRRAKPTDADVPTPNLPPPAIDVPPFIEVRRTPPPGSGEPLVPTEHLVPPGTPPSDPISTWHQDDPPVVPLHEDDPPGVPPPGTPVPVPEPGTLLLFGGAALTLARRLRRRAQ